VRGRVDVADLIVDELGRVAGGVDEGKDATG
jgi:hypothetical protein